MFPIINIGPFAVQAPGLIMLLGLFVGITLAERLATRFDVDGNKLSNLVFVGLVAGLLGARLTFVFQYPFVFLERPGSLFSLSPIMLNVEGGVFIGLIAFLVYGQREKMPFWHTLDALTVLLAVFRFSLGLSHLASGSVYGMSTSLPWGLSLYGEIRHPLPIYEMIAAIIILIVVFPSEKTLNFVRSKSQNGGAYFLLFVSLTALSWIFIESFNGEYEAVLFGFISFSQLIAWFILAFSLYFLEKRISFQQDSIFR